MKALRQFALKLPGTEQGIACAGTKLECPTVTVKGKAFLFAGANHLRLKLTDSIPEAKKLAAKEPDRYSVGANGWIAVASPDGTWPAMSLMQKWTEESYRQFAPKQSDAKKAPAKKSAKSKAKAR